MRFIESARRATSLTRELAAASAALGFSAPACVDILQVGNCLDDGNDQSLRSVVALQRQPNEEALFYGGLE